MTDTLDDKKPTTIQRTSLGGGETSESQQVVFSRPAGWKYKQLKVFGYTLPWFASPKVQLALVATVCFLTVGMFNAISGMGGGGKTDATTANHMNTALYSAFSFFGFFGGSIINRLGVRLTLAFGGLGYSIYAIALLVSVHSDKTMGFSIAAGALLGVCAGLLWTAEGTIMLSYPAEGAKGRYFAWFWAVLNLGGMIGALIPLGQNISVKTNSNVSDSTYIGFIVLMFVGAVVAMIACNAGEILREDGTYVIVMKNPTWKSEFLGLYETLRTDPLIILLFPMFWSSNWFTTYQFNGINNTYYNTRTKALNSVMYWLSQIISALLLGYVLDIERFPRRLRGKIALVSLFILTMAVWGGGYVFAKTYTREDAESPSWVPTDWEFAGYGPTLVLYMAYGFYDAAFQCCVYWFMGALSNNSRKTANYVGFFKGLQSAGAAVMWSLDEHMSLMAEFASNWGLLAGSLVVAAPVIWMRITDSVSIEEDLKFSDETMDEVLGTKVEKDAV